MSHEIGCSSGVGQPCTCAAIRATALDYAKCWTDGRCVMCGAPAGEEPQEFHMGRHLAEGLAVVQYDYNVTPRTARVLPTADVPVVDESGFGIWEGSPADGYDRNDTNAANLRAAYARARDLNAETKRRIAAAKKGRAGLA